MGWFTKKPQHVASLRTELGHFVFSRDYGGWTAFSADDRLRCIYCNDDFDLSALVALRQLLEDLNQFTESALRYIRTEENGFGDMDIEPMPSSIDFTEILNEGQFGLGFDVRDWPDFGITVEFRNGEPFEVWGGD